MPACSFCKKNYEWPRGLTLALNDGKLLYFCSGKCRKNLLRLKRDNKKVNWVVRTKKENIPEEKQKSGEDLKKEEK